MSKRTHEDGTETSRAKIQATENDAPLNAFRNWCGDAAIVFSSKVTIGQKGSCAQYGMVACADIAMGEVLAEIPRKILLTPQTTEISQLLADNRNALAGPSGWVPLLLSLMYETTTPSSKWAPYIQLLPDFSQLDLPMFWPRTELDAELQGTGVPEAVHKDVESLEDEFSNIVLPFVQKHSTVFSPQCQRLELYKQMVAFVMAYSFMEAPAETDDGDDDSPPSPPMMVPVADILNHVANNNAHLDFGVDSLKMISTKPIAKDTEIFNTYGELSNSQLLHMYGFAEMQHFNHHDVVELSIPDLHEALASSDKLGKILLNEKVELLRNMDLWEDAAGCVFGAAGILNMEQVRQTLKVLAMDQSEFDDYKQQDGWSDTDDECDTSDGCLSDSDITNLPSSWKHHLRNWGEVRLTKYNTTLTQEECRHLSGPTELDKRHRYSAYVRHGQLHLLHRLIQLCS